MIPYLICIFPAAYVCLFSYKRYEGNKKVIALLLLPLFILIAFRGITVGSDTKAYTNMFIAMREHIFSLESSYERLEIGFKVLLKVLSTINGDPQILFITQGIVFYLIFINFIEKNTFDPARFIVLFLGLNLFNFYLTGVRQALAMSICLMSYEMAKKRKIVCFLLLILLAFSFHKSAIFFLAVYPLCSKNINKNYVFIDVIAIAVVAALNEKIFAIGGNVFDLNYGIESAQNGYVMIVIVTIVTILSFLYYDSLEIRNPECKILIQLNAVSMALWVLRLYSRTAERVAFYFLPFTILMMIEICVLPRDIRYRRVINLGTVVFFVVYFVYRLNGLGVIPYRFFWQ